MSFCPNGTQRYWRFERFDFAGQARILGRFGSSWSGLASAWRFIRIDSFARTSVPRFCRSLWAIVARGSRCAGRMSFSTPLCRLGRLLLDGLNYFSFLAASRGLTWCKSIILASGGLSCLNFEGVSHVSQRFELVQERENGLDGLFCSQN